MKKPAQHLIAEVPRRHAKVEMTIGIDLGDVWSHYCTLNQDGAVVDRGRFRTTPKAIEKWFTDLPPAHIAMEAGTHSIWISQQLQELGHEVIVANVRELRAISHSDRKSDPADAEKLARFARLDPGAGLVPGPPVAIISSLCVRGPLRGIDVRTSSSIEPTSATARPGGYPAAQPTGAPPGDSPCGASA